MPAVVFVKFEGASWQLEGMPEPGLYPIIPKTKVWFLDKARKKPVLRVRRTQLPLVPYFAITGHAAQGKNPGRSHC